MGAGLAGATWKTFLTDLPFAQRELPWSRPSAKDIGGKFVLLNLKRNKRHAAYTLLVFGCGHDSTEESENGKTNHFNKPHLE